MQNISQNFGVGIQTNQWYQQLKGYVYEALASGVLGQDPEVAGAQELHAAEGSASRRVMSGDQYAQSAGKNFFRLHFSVIMQDGLSWHLRG